MVGYILILVKLGVSLRWNMRFKSAGTIGYFRTNVCEVDFHRSL
jgi:hypothetical protein